MHLKVMNYTNVKDKKERALKNCVIHHIPLGIVSHAVSKVPTDAARLYGLKCSEDLTALPQIEILMQ